MAEHRAAIDGIVKAPCGNCGMEWPYSDCPAGCGHPVVIERLEARVAELEQQLRSARTMQVYSTDECDKHRGHHVWDIELKAGFHNVVKVCPICEQNARSARP